MKRWLVSCQALAVIASTAGSASGQFTVHIDPGNYGGTYNIENSPYTGFQTLVLASDTYRVDNASKTGGGNFYFEVDGTGQVISLSPDSASGSGDTLTFLTAPVDIMNGAYLGLYQLFGFSATSGNNTFHLITDLQYRLGNNSNVTGSSFGFCVSNTGQVTTDANDSAVAAGNTLTLLTMTAEIKIGGYGGLYNLPSFPGDLDDDATLLLIPDLTYRLNNASNTSRGHFDFRFDENGQVTSLNLDAATATSNELHLNSTTIRIKPGEYAGTYGLKSFVGSFTGDNDLQVIPGLEYRIDAGSNLPSSPQTFFVDANGKVAALTGGSGSGNGNEFTFRTLRLHTDPTSYAGTYSIGGYNLPGGPATVVVIPGRETRMTAAGDLLSFTPDWGGVTPSQLTLDVGGTLHDIEFHLAPALIASDWEIDDGVVGGLSDGDGFGISVATLGDLDGDQVEDIAIGASLDDDGGTDRGAVWILFLNADRTVKSTVKLSSTTPGLVGLLDDGDYFGTSIACLGDLDGIGPAVQAIAVGATHDDNDDDGDLNEGAVWILFLNPDGTIHSTQKIDDTDLTANLGVDAFGRAVASLGDLSGGGTNHTIAVGAHSTDGSGDEQGAVWILELDGSGAVLSEQLIGDAELSGTLNDEDRFGISLTSLGDLDAAGTSVATLAVGAAYDDDSGLDHGAVWLLFLDTNGNVLQEQKITSLTGSDLEAGDQFGFSLASRGDRNLDGVPDLLVGARRDDDGGTHRGAIWSVSLNNDGTVLDHDKISDTVGCFTGGSPISTSSEPRSRFWGTSTPTTWARSWSVPSGMTGREPIAGPRGSSFRSRPRRPRGRTTAPGIQEPWGFRRSP